MARYDNLKDYLQNEHIKLINEAVTEYQHDGSIHDEDIKILSLYCTDDKFNNLKMELGVSVNITDVHEAKCKTPFFYKITLCGNLDQGFQDIHVMSVEKSNKSQFPEDNILSQFILPDIRKKDLERIGSELYLYYQYYAGFDGIDFPLDKIINNMNAPIFFTELPDDCLGRVNFYYSDIEIFHYNTSVHELKYNSCHAEPGTILINKKRYYDERDGEFLITVAHELIHWQLHQKFLKLLVILGTDSDTMNCKQEPILYDESMPDIQKAFCIAEWQANALAMRLAIPRSTVDTAIKMVANDPTTRYDNSGDRMQACVIKFAKIYGVSCYVAKERLRQLGYDFVDGTILEYEDNAKKIQSAPFYFRPGTLKENETFVIYRANYEKLFRENKEFAELINTGRYVYLGYVVCRLDSKYIDVIPSSDGVKLVLTDYAREHAEECFIKFKNTVSTRPYMNFSIYSAKYMNKLPEFNEIVLESFELCEDNVELDEGFLETIIDYNYILNNLNSEQCKTFANTLVFHMRRLNTDAKKIHNRVNLSETIIHNYCKGKKEPEDERNIMTLCIGLKLESDYCLDLFKKAGYSLEKDTMQNRCYKFLFDYTHKGLAFCNKILSKFNQDTLPYHHRIGKNRELKKLEVSIKTV